MKKMMRKIRQWLLRPVENDNEKILLSLGRMETRQVQALKTAGLHEAEFQIFSQHGEDGIIQHLINITGTKNRYFIEFGVESYRESNTRFLLMKDNWSGLIIDAGKEHLDYVNRESFLGVNHDLKTVKSFITPDNINDIIRNAGAPKNTGILSIDIDFNDYWVLEAINCIEPDILITEFNSVFGPEQSVTVPRQDRLVKQGASCYYGASLGAMIKAAAKKNMVFAGTESRGINAFFIRKELAASVKETTAEEAFSRLNINGKKDLGRLAAEKEKVLFDTEAGEERTIASIFGL